MKERYALCCHKCGFDMLFEPQAPLIDAIEEATDRHEEGMPDCRGRMTLVTYEKWVNAEDLTAASGGDER